MQWLEDLREVLSPAGPEALTLKDFLAMLRNLGLVILLGHVLAWHYLRYAAVLSNKRKFARMFVFIAATTLLMITVVKTSLALSLGLVGALSIIRFRTPIKEPEELAYLFLAISIGVGLGANQPEVTILTFVVLLIYLAFRSRGRVEADSMQTVLQVTVPVGAEDPTGASRFRDLLPVIEDICDRVDLRRVDRHGDELHASLVVVLSDADRIADLLERVQREMPTSSMSLIDHGGLD